MDEVAVQRNGGCYASSLAHDATIGFILEHIPRYVDRPTIVPFHLAPRPCGIRVESVKRVTTKRTEGTRQRNSTAIQDTAGFRYMVTSFTCQCYRER